MKQLLLILIVQLCISCGSSNNSAEKSNQIENENKLLNSDSLKQNNKNDSKNIDIQYPGEWILSTNFPKGNDYRVLEDIITDSRKIDEMCDYFHAKKSKNFSKDRKIIVACSPETQKWNYYIINLDLLSVEKIYPIGGITQPNIN